MDFVSIVEDLVFFVRPVGFVDGWVEMIVPAFSALLAHTTLQKGGDESPLFGSVLFHECNHLFVFFFKPGTLTQVRIQNLSPAVHALRI